MVSVDLYAVSLTPVEVGGKYYFRGRVRPLSITESEAYVAKVGLARSSFASRSTYHQAGVSPRRTKLSGSVRAA